LPRNLYLAWQDQGTRAWHTFARLSRVGSDYVLAFTRGVESLHGVPLDLFKVDVNKEYRFSELIPVFKNRLPSPGRSDFAKLAGWLNLSGEEDEFSLLARFGLIPGTDSILIYPEPEIQMGRYQVEFFVHGIRHMHRDVLSLCSGLRQGERLLPVLDIQNSHDENAVALRCENEPLLIGYVPKFYAADLRDLLSRPKIAENARVTVVKSNSDAPSQLKLLCRFVADAPPGFRALQTDAHKLIIDELAVA
jgi:hypothetical protein